jgi:hypothetical protein
MAFGHHVSLVSDSGLLGRIAHQRDMEANSYAAETQSPEGSKRSGEAPKALDGVSAAWPCRDALAIDARTG